MNTVNESARLRLQRPHFDNRIANKLRLGDRDLNPDYLIQSQAFCRLNYPPSDEYIHQMLTHSQVTNQIDCPFEFHLTWRPAC